MVVMVNIAIDQCIGIKRMKQLQSLGYNVVTRAESSEKDSSWMNRAFANGALFVISADMDIPKIIEVEKYPMIWIDCPHHNKNLGCDVITYIDNMIKFKLQFFRDVAEGGYGVAV
jgi:hypothetical protein